MNRIICDRGKWITLILTSLLWICAGCTPTAGARIQVTGAWVRAVNIQQGTSGNSSPSQATGMPGMPGMSGATSAVYLTIQNTGSQADRLVSVTSDVAQSVEIHQSQVQNNVASMQLLDTLELPAQSKIQFQPGGYHLMLIGVNRNLNPGDKITVNLQFEKSAPILVEAEVRGP